MHSYSIRAIFKLTIDPFSTSRNTFIARNSDNQHSFALISEVVDSKPPRLNKLRPALILTLAMLIIVAIGPALFPEQNMQSLLGKCSYGLIESLRKFMHRLLTLFCLSLCSNWQQFSVCGLVVSFIFVCMGILSQQECRDAVNWEVYVTISCSFGIGTAMTNSVRLGLVRLNCSSNIVHHWF